MSKVEKTEVKRATALGIYGSRRVRPGETFTAPVDFKGKWFKPAFEGGKPVDVAQPEDFNVLALSASEVKEQVGALTTDQINKAISAETGSNKRKNVLALLRDELANRVGAIDTPDPASKQSEEKDPLTVAQDDDLMK